jgi:hypothetical protein
MQERVVQDEQTTEWSCVEAVALLGDTHEHDADSSDGQGRQVAIVCTPRGGAQSVRLKVRASWLSDLSDEDLLEAITNAR